MRQRLSLLGIVLWMFPIVALGQDDSAASAKVRVVDFQRDVAPIFALRCLKCHGAEDAKNDFRIDSQESVLGYIEPGDIDASSLWTDYLRSDDPDLQMPPADHGGPLSASELALVSVWITEGADWPDNAVIGSETVAVVVAPAAVVAKPMSLVARIWAFQGFLHPATVHFPIALLVVGGLFVVVGLKYPVLGENVAIVCLFLGTVSAVLATAMGWSFATRQGYGSWDRFDTDAEIFWHRWSAVVVTLSAIVTSLFAIAWLSGRNKRIGKIWKVGLLAIAAMVGAVGHQGGELTYGETFYQEAFDLLLGTQPSSEAAAVATNVNADSTASFGIVPGQK